MPQPPQSYDVVVVGAGIGGGAAATVLARAGLKVLLLEKTAQHKDVVRGEWLAPWGVLEANALGLTEMYMAAGAHRIATHQSYNEFQNGPAADMPLADMVPEQPLCLGHPQTCNLLNQAAVEAGVTFLREIRQLKVTAGLPPQVEFIHDKESYVFQPKLVIGADGRNGVVAKQIGCTLSQDAEHHLFSGMLVEGAHDWPADLQVIATEGDANVLAFPQGQGRVRIYLGWPSADRQRLLGPEGPQRFLDSWQLDCVPAADAIVNATPVSPCIAYPNFDAWVDSPIRPGVVLIGDAAGRNDPIIGQGLSITLTDVRQLRDALLDEMPDGEAPPAGWSTDVFDAYVTERTERMRRLRTVARLTTLRESAFGAGGYALRHTIHERLAANEDLAAPFAAGFTGPFALPGEVFSDEFTTQIVGQPIWDPALP